MSGHTGGVGHLKLWLSSCLGPCSVGSCTIFFSQKDFALTNTEKNIHKESETKEAREEELDTEVLEVFQPTHEWQTLQPGTRPALLL